MWTIENRSHTQDLPEPRAEGTLHAGLHHAHAPEQQSHHAGEIEQGQRGTHFQAELFH